MADSLRPCPFCGGKAILNSFMAAYVSCKKCGIDGKRFDMFETERAKERAIEAWNTRDDGDIDIDALFAERDYYKSVAKHVYRVMQEAKELMQYIPRTCSTCYANDMDIREVDNPCWNCKGRGYPNWKWRNADHFREVTEMVDRGSYGSD